MPEESEGATRSAGASRPGAIVLLSGGLDSCVAASWAAARYELRLLHADYGQRTAIRERASFDRIADALGVSCERRLHVAMELLSRVGGSSLTDARREVETGEPDPTRIPGTYVPFRNAHLLAAGISWAETVGATRIVIGCVEEDSSGYPDCRASFVQAFNRVVAEGTRSGSDLRVEAPLVAMNKAEIVRLGVDLGAPLEHTWSCYTDNRTACGICESCRLRRRGFDRAGVVDPVPYRGA